MLPLEVTTSVARPVWLAGYTSRELDLPRLGEGDTAGGGGEFCRVMGDAASGRGGVMCCRFITLC